ncbi:hypothetical protein KY329_01745 [Candidatus Woesearchaeota archaeon]|nr:hypothetical protein [Candidatus Woesearchaeota archaeon]
MKPFAVKHKQTGELCRVLHIFSDSDGAILCLLASSSGEMKEVHLNRLRENYTFENLL